MKKGLFTLILALSILSYATTVEAKTSISIGTNYGSGPSSTGEATTAYNQTKSMGYTAYLVLSPTTSNLKNNANLFKNSGGNGALFFHGHANSERIIWNYLGIGGPYAVGITRYGSMSSNDGYDLLATSEFGLSNAKLAVFMGCNTATASTNIASDARAKGASATIGWAATIYEGDTDKWVSRFYSKLATGATISSSVSFANSFSDYSHNSAIKATRLYGNTGVSVKSLDNIATNIKMNDVVGLKEKVYFLQNNRITISKAEAINYIKEAYNSNLDSDKYLIEHVVNDIQEIYDFNLIINGVRSNIGYTVIVENGKVTTIDNMKNYSENISDFTNIQSINEFNEEEAVQIALSRNPVINDNIRITLDSTLKRYDVDTKKMYFDVNLKYYDTLLGVKSIITETFEM